MLHELLELRPGVTTVIGSGGKTTLLRTLGRELSAGGNRVILCTTTKIFPFSDMPCITDPQQLKGALERESLVCFGTQLPNGKLAAPAMAFEEMCTLADYVIAEGDGSKGLPLKAHLDFEPVIPPESGQTICVVGLSGLNQPISQAVHRPERFGELAGLALQAPASSQAVARVLNAEALANRYVLNQADLPGCREGGVILKRLLPRAVLVSLHTGEVLE